MLGPFSDHDAPESWCCSACAALEAEGGGHYPVLEFTCPGLRLSVVKNLQVVREPCGMLCVPSACARPQLLLMQRFDFPSAVTLEYSSPCCGYPQP